MGSHRASSRDRRRSTPTTTGTTGRRRSNRRRPRAIPSVIGVVALAAAGFGAVALGHGGHSGDGRITLSAGRAHTGGDADGTDAIFGRGGYARAQAISRDSDRVAQQNAVQQRLQAEAEAQNRQRNAALNSLAKAAERRSGDIAKNQWVLPTTGYHLTARFGQSSGLWSHFHTGLDFATAEGTPIHALADGVIVSTGYDGSYGNKTVERLSDGTEIWYAHQSEIKVDPGEHVTQSETIGLVGSTGNTTGPHVHIEVRPGGGDPVDPYPQFIYHGVTP